LAFLLDSTIVGYSIPFFISDQSTLRTWAG
jgi:hypothetical protein